MAAARELPDGFQPLPNPRRALVAITQIVVDTDRQSPTPRFTIHYEVYASRDMYDAGIPMYTNRSITRTVAELSGVVESAWQLLSRELGFSMAETAEVPRKDNSRPDGGR